MPRQPRLDIPDLLQHVIVRGIERGKIFRDDVDRRDFLERFRSLLAETGTECFAWALMPNHFHLLLRPRQVELSRFMRRLLTGYAITFNRRHKRSGPLFQHRYKSILCEEEVYLLELVRYIHLNPLRAGLVPDLETLDSYPWCGHAELLEKRPSTGLSCDSVLELFGGKHKAARLAYRQFLADGLTMGNRPELVGGGLRRSQALSQRTEEHQDYDDRILGSGKFVESLREEGLLQSSLSPRMGLMELQTAIEGYYQLPSQGLCQRGRQNTVAEARVVFCYYGVRWLHHSGAAVGRHLGVGPSSVTRSVRRGEKIIATNRKLKIGIEQAIKQ
ncbi:MAG: transposase [Desulfuromonadales bacterium]|nr:transposase [Desulfuromonadales bacterium]